MPVCEICSEELACDSELKTHLLLTHLEDEVSCPLCSLSGVSYDELNFHINTAHAEMDSGHTAATGEPGHPKRKSETGAGLSSVSRSPESQNGVMKLNHRHAGETSDPGKKHEKTRGSNMMELLASKQRRLSSPSKGRTFSCPLCDLVCTDCFMMQEHVELHLQDHAVSDGAVYVCPMCKVACDDSCSLQEHVELHLDNSPAGDFYGDLRFAQQLQEEEECKRKEEEAKREAEEFRQLQMQFGLDNGGGYRKQMERSMEQAVSRGHMTPTEFHMKRLEMMETLAAGLDDGQTRTTGLLSALYKFYQRERQEGTRVWLCSELEHYSSSDGDRGWGCGYRNFQMLLSSLQRLEQYTTLHTLSDSCPSIPQVQALIEAAWVEGIDPQGASQFNGRLKGTRAWIGATEIYTILTSLKLRARVVDFHQPTGPGDTHPRLFRWVKNYFSLPSSTGARVPPRVVKTNLPPIYLQHQGHSRTIVGVEERRNGSICVLMFDPGCSPAEMRKLLNPNTSPSHFNRLRKFPTHLKKQQYQVVVVEGVLSEDEKQERVITSRIFHAERIP
ncbi:zinc finger-containing ubiquitin peptidase 1 isoform X1 [Tachysurus vachellii]|uniref:zinc finger-containing ubiquitin peptidase 1 isoform X1 n=1 Tax=Tachysurus vachellii TaxID=175792 RepID=UPI00296ACA71|nr:zinc finger-containing ubiquitin peptidase 1 isoform X1 [Tachysurus vachellii]XP_060728839.1 zinc finger-containing ubiquitin peptidase 1 isoform X1 [Tachysurus vachellii]